MTESSTTGRRGSHPVEKQDNRHGARERERALCCECGTLRTIATTYYGRQPTEPIMGRSLKWVRCATCKVVTTHAVIEDASTRWRPDGTTACAGERDNLEQTKAQREFPRLLERCGELHIELEWVEDLPRWEKRRNGSWQRPDQIVAEVGNSTAMGEIRCYNARIIEGAPATEIVGSLHKIITCVELEGVPAGKLVGACGCGWGMEACSCCPGEAWRWRG